MSECELRQRGANIGKNQRWIHLANHLLLANRSLKIPCVHRVQADVVSLDCVAGINLYRASAFFQSARHIPAVKVCQRKIRHPGIVCGVPANQLLEFFLGLFRFARDEVIGGSRPVLLAIAHAVDLR